MAASLPLLQTPSLPNIHAALKFGREGFNLVEKTAVALQNSPAAPFIANTPAGTAIEAARCASAAVRLANNNASLSLVREQIVNAGVHAAFAFTPLPPGVSKIAAPPTAQALNNVLARRGYK